MTSDDAENAMLDLIETSVLTAITLGLEAPLEARLERLLPKRGRVPEPAPKAAEAPEAAPRDVERELTLANGLAVLRRINPRLSESDHATLARLKDALRKEIAA